MAEGGRTSEGRRRGAGRRSGGPDAGDGRPVPPVVRRVAWALTAVAAAAVVLAAPLSGWWEQRGQISGAEAELSALEADVERLRERLERTQDPDEIERVARREFGMVREGEESYAVLPPATAGVVLPDEWPFNRIAASLVAPG